MNLITCDIVTPKQKLYTEDCYMVEVPGVSGSMGFMKGHSNLVSLLADGLVRVFSDANTLEHQIVLQGGYVQVDGDKAIVLADRAVLLEDVDTSKLPDQIQETQEKLDQAGDDEAAKELLELDLDWYKLLQRETGGAANQNE